MQHKGLIYNIKTAALAEMAGMEHEYAPFNVIIRICRKIRRKLWVRPTHPFILGPHADIIILGNQPNSNYFRDRKKIKINKQSHKRAC